MKMNASGVRQSGLLSVVEDDMLLDGRKWKMSPRGEEAAIYTFILQPLKGFPLKSLPFGAKLALE